VAKDLFDVSWDRSDIAKLMPKLNMF
jgi:hypothetical protein